MKFLTPDVLETAGIRQKLVAQLQEKFLVSLEFH